MTDTSFSRDPRSANPHGDRIIAFLFTDIEDSTAHGQRFPEGMRDAHVRHDDILRTAAKTFGGDLFQSVGDGFKIAFTEPVIALEAAFEVQRVLQTVFVDADGTIPLRVRMALHAGITEERDGEYVGLTPAKADRLLEKVQGGQVVLTGDTADLVRHRLPDVAALQDLGEYRLRSFETTPDRLFQLIHPDLPALFAPLLKTIGPNNLPRQVSQFIGRDKELGEIRTRILTSPLVTLRGAGGCGKTRLALQVSDNILRKFSEGVWFIDLSHCDDAASVARVTAAALGIKPEPDRALKDQIIEHLGALRCLLILDNCELRIEAAAELVRELLTASSEVRILATSREPLGITGEVVYAVRPLPIPPVNENRAKTLMACDSVRLFAFRAASRSAFSLTPENVATVANICRRLDGIPLAIEIMASWTEMLTPTQIEERMKKRFPLDKSSGARDSPDRHRTIRAAIDYSLDLLNEAERALLPRLAIFSGGWTLDAAEAVGVGEPVEDMLESLTMLARKSLVEVEDADPVKRYRMLQPIREYALEILTKSGEYEELRARHRDYFVEWVSGEASRLTAGDERIALHEVDREIDNLRAALATIPNTTTGLRVFAALFWYCHVRGYIREGIALGNRFLEMDSRSPIADDLLRANARNGAGILCWDAGDLSAARRYFSEALALFQQLGAKDRIASCLSNLAAVVGDRQLTHEYQEASLDYYRGLGEWPMVARVLNNLGAEKIKGGELTEAREFVQDALQIQRPEGPTLPLSQTLINLAEIQIKENQLRAAADSIEESLRIREDFAYTEGIAHCLDIFPLLANALADPPLAARLMGLSAQYRLIHDISRPSDIEQDLESLRSYLLEKLGKKNYDAEVKKGSSLSYNEIAVELFNAAYDSSLQ